MFARALLLSLSTVASLALASPASAQLGQSAGYKLMEAIKKSDGAEATKILNKPGSTVINYKDPSTGETALHVVVKRQDSTYLRFLLAKEADPNLRDNRGNTPMLVAVDSGFDAGVAILIEAKAAVDASNSSGETPLIHAVQRRNLGLVRDLIAAGADPDKTDVIAGRSARDYANLDTRAPEIAKLIAATPKREKRAVSGPVFKR